MSWQTGTEVDDIPEFPSPEMARHADEDCKSWLAIRECDSPSIIILYNATKSRTGQLPVLLLANISMSYTSFWVYTNPETVSYILIELPKLCDQDGNIDTSRTDYILP